MCRAKGMPLLTRQSRVGRSLTTQRGVMQEFKVGYPKAALGLSLYVIGCEPTSLLLGYKRAKH